jgi:alcohol dehydrogenase class IV
MNSFSLSIPTRLHFGCGITATALRAEAAILQGNILLVSPGKSLRASGTEGTLLESLSKQTGGKVVLFKDISPNPKLTEIDAAAQLAIEQHATCVVGFGGGSAMDAAKAIAAAAGMGVSASDLFYGKCTADVRTLPIIAIPTTAGTGSEMSKAAIVSDSETHKKDGIRGDALYPTVAIVDPVYT